MLLISKFNTVAYATKKLEERYGVELPLEYKKFLDKYNGGTTPKTYVKIGRNKDDVRAFYEVGKVNEYYTFDALEELGVVTEFIEKNYSL